MLTTVLSNKLGQVTFGIAAAFVLYGAVTNDRIFLAVVLLVCIRLIAIVNEGFRKRFTSADWDARYQRLVESYSQMTTEELAAEIDGLDKRAPISPQQHAASVVSDEQSIYIAPRRASELVLEGLGLIALVVLAPLTIAFHAREFVSLRLVQDWVGLLVILACVGLYLWPFRWRSSDEQHRNRMLWWGLPVLPVLGLFQAGLARHPYLDPTVPNRQQLAADKVLALSDTVVAGRHPDWVFDYAEALEGNNIRAAIDYYKRGLNLAPQAERARARLGTLQATTGSNSVLPARTDLDPHRPYWPATQVIPKLPVCRIDEAMERVSSTTIVLVRTRDITTELMNQLGGRSLQTGARFRRREAGRRSPILIKELRTAALSWELNAANIALIARGENAHMQ